MQIIKYMFQQHGDERGQLVALEACRDIPFEIKRVYYMYDTGENVTRGYHAHKNLEQILICVHGSCKVLLDNGKEKEKITSVIGIEVLGDADIGMPCVMTVTIIIFCQFYNKRQNAEYCQNRQK